MRATLPPSTVVAGHVDYPNLSEIRAEIFRCAGGQGEFEQYVPKLLRECIDDVIQTPRTRRRSYAELEKVEKTYIGTRVEIMLRSWLGLPKGKLDVVVANQDVDIKNTLGANWMIPTEAFGHACILIGADEKKSKCYVGLIFIREAYLSASENKDKKKTLSPFRAKPNFCGSDE